MNPSAAATHGTTGTFETGTSTHETAGLAADHPLMDGRTADSPLITAYRGGKPSRRPVWFMRQAGRSLPEYLKIREGVAMLDSCLRPELASEITLQPVRRHDVDAAIFFSDIVIPLKLAGVGVDIVPGVGPVLDKPVRTAADVAALPQLTWEALEPIREAVRLTVAELGSTPLIGFAGAPFTLAAYMVEGKPSRDHLGPRTMMHADPETWTALANWAADASGLFLRAQLEAGASAGQLFDSWAGSLGLADYQRFVAPASVARPGPRPAPWRPADPLRHRHLGTARGHARRRRRRRRRRLPAAARRSQPPPRRDGAAAGQHRPGTALGALGRPRSTRPGSHRGRRLRLRAMS